MFWLRNKKNTFWYTFLTKCLERGGGGVGVPVALL